MSAGAQNQASPGHRSGAFSVEAGGDRIGGKLFIVGDYLWVKISSRDTNGAFAVLESYSPPLAGPPLHLHHNQDEWFYIIEGQYLFEVDGRRFEVGPGATVFAPRETRHTFQNIGTTPGRAIVTVVPGGIDIFFEELSAAVPPGAVPDPAVLVPLFQKHGLELLGPPLGAR